MGKITLVLALVFPLVLTSCLQGPRRTVQPPPPKVTVEIVPDTLTIVVGQTQKLTVKVIGSTKAPSFSSSETSVASVKSDGTVTGLAVGNATITAAVGSASGSALVTVAKDPPVLKTIAVKPSGAQISVSTKQTYTASGVDQYGNAMTGINFVFASANPAIISITPSGDAVGLSTGTTMITATADSITGSANVTVTPFVAPPALKTVVVKPGNAQVKISAMQAYTASGFDQYGNAMAGISFIFASANPSVISITEAGVAVGLSAGITQITATADGISGSAMVTVIPATIPPPPPPLGSILLNPVTATIQVGAIQVFTAEALNTNGAPISVPIAFNSSNTSVATISAGGVATGLSSGITAITASSGNVVSVPSMLTVTVPPPPPTVTKLSPPLAIAGSDYSIPLTISGTGFDDSTVVEGFGSALTPLSVTPTTMTVTLPQSVLASIRTAEVTVSNLNGTSTPMPFYITNQGFVAVSFDDGYQSTYDNGLPILDAANMSYTWYIITHAPQPAISYFATWAEIVSEGAKPNVEIGNHTETHAGVECTTDPGCPLPSWMPPPVGVGSPLGGIRFLTILDPAGESMPINGMDNGPETTSLPAETAGAQQDLVYMGLNPTTFAYPYGDYDYSPDQNNNPNELPLAQQPVELAVQSAKLKGARTTNFCQDDPASSTPPECGYTFGTAGDQTALPYAIFAFEVNQSGSACTTCQQGGLGPITSLAEIEYWTSPALPQNAGGQNKWTILTFHNVDEDPAQEPDSVPHQLIQDMVTYFQAQHIFTVTVSEGMTIMNMNGLN